MLNRHSPSPLYRQCEQEIGRLLDNGFWPPETQLPSELDLCERFGISRITVRQALHKLVSEGRLLRAHGRGTFVARASVRKCIPPLVDFSEEFARGQKPGARVLSFEAILPTEAVSQELRLSTGERVVRLKRLRFADGVPMALETVYAPERLFPGLLEEDMADCSLYGLVVRRYGIRPARATQNWRAVACPRADAKLLAIRTGSPVLQIGRTTYERGGRAFEHLHSFFRGDRHVYHAEIGDRTADWTALREAAASR